MKRLGLAAGGSLAALLLLACQPEEPPEPPDPGDELAKRGERLFFEETFEGNGRTCGTCHPRENNFTLDPAFIATLPNDDPLFVAETNPDLAENFENPRLMRQLGLILENLDGFGDPENVFVMRGIPHTLALKTSVASGAGPRTGWSGDGAPGDGSLRSFAMGAVIQHFTKTTNRIAGVDFRLPTDEELEALEAFQLSLGRREDLTLPIALEGDAASRGQEIFLDRTLGKCSLCHSNAGANGDPAVFGPQAGNLSFDTGVEALPDQPADLTGELVPPDDGFGRPGNGQFNTPPLVEAADTPPFFHNNAVATIEGAVAFYNGDAFNNSLAGQVLAGATGGGINLDATQVEAVAAFLRVLNALENIRQSIELLEASGKARPSERVVSQVSHEIEDAIQVLAERALHLDAVALLREARASVERKPPQSREAIELLREARSRLVGGTA
jgi:mono/diheme cytochrome c family protein